MYENDIAGGCYAALAVIDKHGWTTGDRGWFGEGAVCLEGALFKVLGMEVSRDDNFQMAWVSGPEVISVFEKKRREMQAHPVAQAILNHLMASDTYFYGTLFHFNDSSGQQTVQRVLREVAAAHSKDKFTIDEYVKRGIVAQAKASLSRLREKKPTVPVAAWVEPGESKPVEWFTMPTTTSGDHMTMHFTYYGVAPKKDQIKV